MMCAVQSQATATSDLGPLDPEGPPGAKHQPFADQHGVVQKAAPCPSNITKPTCAALHRSCGAALTWQSSVRTIHCW